MLIALANSVRSVPAQSSDEREFVGTINKTLKVHLRLSQSGNVLSGSYAYDRIGKSLRLSGAMTSGVASTKEFTLNEYDDRGRETGKFEGTFVSTIGSKAPGHQLTRKERCPLAPGQLTANRFQSQTQTTGSVENTAGGQKRQD